jgi:RNA polymerase sigma factor (TIGR02999 family)
MAKGFVDTPENFTELLSRARLGDRIAANLAYQLAFPRLRSIASAMLYRHRSHATLQPTALVSELYVRLRGWPVVLTNREHFFRLAARAMGQVLTDRSRAGAARRARLAYLLEHLAANDMSMEEELAGSLREILARFSAIDPQAAQVIRLHSMEGYTWEETARRLGCEVWEARRDADFAINWMRRNLL